MIQKVKHDQNWQKRGSKWLDGQIDDVTTFESLNSFPRDLGAFHLLHSIHIKGWAQNRGLFDCKFRIVRIGQFWRSQRHWTQKICGIAWVCKKTIFNENPSPQLSLNSNSVGNFYSKITKVFPEVVHEYFCWKLIYFGSGT